MDKRITATLLRRQLHDALQLAESAAGRVLVTRHGKVVAALVSAADLEALKQVRSTEPKSLLAEVETDFIRTEEGVVKAIASSYVLMDGSKLPAPLPADKPVAEAPKPTKLILDL